MDEARIAGLGPDSPTVDLAYQILKNAGSPMYYKDLIEEIIRIKGLDAGNVGRLKARIHTEINLDHRFAHMGKGLWGLKKWAPRRTAPSRVVPLGTAAPRPKRDLRQEEEEERLDELDLLESEEEEREGWDYDE